MTGSGRWRRDREGGCRGIRRGGESCGGVGSGRRVGGRCGRDGGGVEDMVIEE